MTMLDTDGPIGIGWRVMMVPPLIALFGLTVWCSFPGRKFHSRGQCSHCGHKRDATGRYCRACIRAYHRLRRRYLKGKVA